MAAHESPRTTILSGTFQELRKNAAELSGLGDTSPDPAMVGRLQAEVNIQINVNSFWLPSDDLPDDLTQLPAVEDLVTKAAHSSEVINATDPSKETTTEDPSTTLADFGGARI